MTTPPQSPMHRAFDETHRGYIFKSAADRNLALIEFEAGWRAASNLRAPQSDWISVDERLPDTGVSVLVYEPARPDDWPGTVRVSIDHICPDYEDWYEHCACYEHFMAVGGVNAAGPDCSCTGPGAKALYTHWHALPPPPSTKGEPA